MYFFFLKLANHRCPLIFAYEVFLTNHWRGKLDGFLGVALPRLWLDRFNQNHGSHLPNLTVWIQTLYNDFFTCFKISEVEQIFFQYSMLKIFNLQTATPMTMTTTTPRAIMYFMFSSQNLFLSFAACVSNWLAPWCNASALSSVA